MTSRSRRKSALHKQAMQARAFDECEGRFDYRRFSSRDFPRFKPAPEYCVEGNRKQQERVSKARWVQEETHHG